MRHKRVPWICPVLIGLGLVVSIYLLLLYLGFTGTETGSGKDLCVFLFKISCKPQVYSPTSYQLGIPTPGWGVIYYLTLALLLYLGRMFGERFRNQAVTAAFALSALAALGSVLLLGVMLVTPALFCPLCTAVHAVNFALLFPLKRMTGRPLRQTGQSLAAGARYVFTGKSDNPELARWRTLAFALTALVALVFYQWVRFEVRLRASANPVPFHPENVLAAYDSTARRIIPLDPADATKGPPDAPVRLVVFSDFQCPACKYFSAITKWLMNRFEGRLRIVYKHMPLGSACNPLVPRDLHPGACEAARAAEAARLQGKFWDFHDRLFSLNLNRRRFRFDGLAGELGLNLSTFRSDFQAESTAEKIRSDVELGKKLGVVQAIPAVFLNGRRILDIRRETYELLIAYELRRQSR